MTTEAITLQGEKKKSEKGKEIQTGRYAGLDSSPIYTDFSRVIPLQSTRAFSVLSLKDGEE